MLFTPFRAVLTASLLAAHALVGAQQAYPLARPIELVLPATPGGLMDGVARAVGRALHESMGATVVIRNESSGSGMVAGRAVASAKPDGYTIGWVQGSQLTMVPHFVKAPFTLEQLAPVSLLYRGPMLLSVTKDVPATNLKELTDLIRKEGKALPVGVSATGGLAHLTAELFSMSSGLPTLSVPYRGEAPIILDMLGANIPAAVTTYNAVSQHISTGAIRVLAATSETRLTALPNVPTFKESGYADVIATFWHGIVAPKGTPRAVIDTLNQALAKAIESEAVRKLLTDDLEIVNSTPEEFDAIIHADNKRWGDLIESRGIRQQ